MSIRDPKQSGPPGPAMQPDEAAARLIALIESFLRESRAGRSVNVTLDGRLDRDLGIDSLGKVELLLRAEREFGVSLPENALVDAETPRELLRAALAARGPAAPADHEVRALSAGGAAEYPDYAATLPEVVDWHLKRHAQRLHIHLYGQDDAAEDLTYAALAEGARAVAATLAERGLEPGQTVAIMLPTGKDYFFSFLGILLAGGVPVPIYPPLRLSHLEDHMQRHVGILTNAQVAMLITVPEAKTVALLLTSRVVTLAAVLTPADFKPGRDFYLRPRVATDDIAFLQYTSGSTGAPKGVILTHANLLANIRAMGRAVRATPDDVFVSWLPLYHDMGLIGAWMGALYFGFPTAIMSPLAFLSRPHRWLWAIHRHRGTLSAAPNFAYELAVRKIDERDIEGVDLSSWRYAFNGAEPVSPDTLAAFRDRFRRYGLKPAAIAPVFGLAECSVGLAFPPPGREPAIDRVKREPFMKSGRAEPAGENEREALRFVGCGLPIEGHEIRVVDAAGRELGDREQGRLHFKGPSATRGYYRNPEATKKLLAGDWLDTGDYAYLVGGEIYLTGRAKDVIIRGGRNIYPYDLEQAVGDIEGVRKGCVAVFGAKEEGSGNERIIVLAETRETDAERRSALERRIAEAATAVIGMPVDEIVLAPPHTVLKTSSGKIRRAASREFYERRGTARRPAPVWWQVTRLAWRASWPELRRRASAAWATARGGWMLACFALLAPPTWAVVSAMQRPALARPFTRVMARFFFALAGISLRARGIDKLPRGACVLAANHTSYLDGIALAAVLPGSHAHMFAAKREFVSHWLPRWFLTGFGAAFVDRVDPRRGTDDVAQFSAALAAGHTVIFFPEGTFDRQSGLKPFRAGGFAVAARVGVPVVPVTIRGARAILRGNDILPRPGAISIVVGDTVRPTGSSWAATIRLRDAVRAEILRECGEADLAH
ncbi:MAG TPA: AMP-binding protein [Pelomicrobium sp.]|nr:AMP-binding protein [Pelomicrobium sp.]